MNDISFQTFYASHEESNCPLIPEMVKLGKKMNELDILKDNSVSISLKYGKRVLINSRETIFSDVKRENVLEIVDYDPVKKVVLAIGRNEPCMETPLHWMIHYAREDVHVVAQITGEKILEKACNKLPETEQNYPTGSLEQIKDVMKTLRINKNIVIKNRGVLFTGSNIDEIVEMLQNFFGGGSYR